jgi:hypothetical protein
VGVEMLYRKSNGNPYFVNRFLTSESVSKYRGAFLVCQENMNAELAGISFWQKRVERPFPIQNLSSTRIIRIINEFKA